MALGVSWSLFWEVWGSILGVKIVNFGFLGALGTQKKTSPEKELKKSRFSHMQSSILETILASFFDDFSVYFSVRFLDHFWSDFGAIWGAKMELKSLKNRVKIRSIFWLDFRSVPGRFLVDFWSVLGSLDPQK